MSDREYESFLLEILDEQDAFEVDREKITFLCEAMIADRQVKTGRLGVVLVDGDTIRQYNRDFLEHDYVTDVISFPIEDRLSEGHLEGEILVCTQIALDRAEEFGWTPGEEILLYVVHGVLHLLGLDDTTPDLRREMRQKENDYLGLLGIVVPDWNYESPDPGAVDEPGPEELN